MIFMPLAMVTRKVDDYPNGSVFKLNFIAEEIMEDFFQFFYI